MSYLLKHATDSIDKNAFRKLIKKGAKAKSDEIIEALKDYIIETAHKKLELARRHLEYLDDMITQTAWTWVTLMKRNIIIHGTAFLLRTTNLQTRKICQDYQNRRLLKTHDSTVCPCRNQEQKTVLLCNQIRAN